MVPLWNSFETLEAALTDYTVMFSYVMKLDRQWTKWCVAAESIQGWFHLSSDATVVQIVRQCPSVGDRSMGVTDDTVQAVHQRRI